MGSGSATPPGPTVDDDRVTELSVIEALEAVISWHERDLLPDTVGLAADPRVRLVRDDFVDVVRAGRVNRTYDIVLLDIDHAPDWLLRQDHGDLYAADGFARVAALLSDGGAFALWSDEAPEPETVRRMAAAFEHAGAHVVPLPNPLTGGEAANTVYLAARPRR